MTAKVADFPTGARLRPEQALAEAGKRTWETVIAVGITQDGDFEVVNSDMTAERALWLIEWGRQWALGLDSDDYDEPDAG